MIMEYFFIDKQVYLYGLFIITKILMLIFNMFLRREIIY